MNRVMRIVNLWLVALTLVSCGGGGGSAVDNAVPTGSLTAVEISAAASSIAVGTDDQLQATAIYSDGTRQVVSANGTWTTSDAQIAAFTDANSTGLLHGVGVGTVAVAFTFQGLSGSTSVTVTSAAIESIQLSPANLNLAKGTAAQVTGTGVFSDGSKQDVTAKLSWLSDNPDIAVVDTVGHVVAKAVGSVVVHAAFGSIQSTVAVQVSNATLSALTVTPPTLSLPKGVSSHFTAMGIFSDGTSQDLTSSATWSSDNAAVASVVLTGASAGMVSTASDIGTAHISASIGSINSNLAVVNVTAATLQSIELTPSSASLAKGLTKQMLATGLFSDGSTSDVTAAVTWKSDNPAVATVSNAASSAGLATFLSPGLANVTATFQGIASGAASLQVTAASLVTIAITPSTTNVAAGQSQQYVAKGTFSDGSISDLTASVTWKSSDTAVATISSAAGSDGLAKSQAAGTTNITATLGSITSPAVLLRVSSATLSSISVTSPSASLAAGQQQQFQATGTFSDGSTSTLTNSVIWTSSSSAIATISNAPGSYGLVTSLSPGSVNVTASLGPIVSNAVTLNITSATLTSLLVSPASVTLAAGLTQQFRATGGFSDGSSSDMTNAVIWTSDNTAVATVSNAASSFGLVTTSISGATGTAHISAAKGSVNSTPATLNAVYAAFTVSVAVSGLSTGSSVTLSNGSDSLLLGNNTTSSFKTTVSPGGSYSVKVATQPQGQTCNVISGSGSGVSANVIVNVVCASFFATPSVLSGSNGAVLKWDIAGATNCTINGLSGNFGGASSVTVNPNTSTTYSLNCQGSAGNALPPVSTAVIVPTTAALTASPFGILGSSITLTWSSRNASGCHAIQTSNTNWISGQNTPAGTVSVPTPTGFQAGTVLTYSLQCTDPSGLALASATAQVEIADKPPLPDVCHVVYARLPLSSSDSSVNTVNSLHLASEVQSLGLSAVQLAALARSENLESDIETDGDGTTAQPGIQNLISDPACLGKAVELSASGSNFAFLINTLSFPDGVSLIVDGDVVVYATRDPSRYHANEISKTQNGWPSLLNFGSGGGLYGFGAIDGRAYTQVSACDSTAYPNGCPTWYQNLANYQADSQNPALLVLPYLVSARGVCCSKPLAGTFNILDVTLRNSPFWHIRVQDFKRAEVWGLKVSSPWNVANTDGIDFYDVDSGIIAYSSFSEGDDDIAIDSDGEINSPTRNVLIDHVTIYGRDGVAIGSHIGTTILGSTPNNVIVKGGIANVVVQDVNITSDPILTATTVMAQPFSSVGKAALPLTSGATRGLYFKIPSNPGPVSALVYNNICIQDINVPVYVGAYNSYFTTVSGVSSANGVVYNNVNVLDSGIPAAWYSPSSRITFEGMLQYPVSALITNSFTTSTDKMSVGANATVSGTFSAANQTTAVCGVDLSNRSNANSGLNTQAFPYLVADLYATQQLPVQGPAKNNLSIVTRQIGDTVTLRATVRPAMTQHTLNLSKSLWGVPLNAIASPPLRGTVTFYLVSNGQSVPLGSVVVGQSGWNAGSNTASLTLGPGLTGEFTAKYVDATDAASKNYQDYWFGALNIN